MVISRESNKIMENQLKELKEIAPNIGDDILNEILKENDYDIEKSIDSTLALIISLSNDNDQTKAINSRTTSNIRDPEVYYRGAPMYLPNTFLCCPVFRSAIDNVTLNSIDFTVYLRRERRSLGIVFGLTNGEISVSSLPSRSLDMNELSFASLAGIKVGDILKGLDSEYFCPGAEVQDVNDIIHYSDRYLKLHFSRRKKSNNLIFENQNENHKYTQMMIEQNVISPSIASNVNTMLTRLRDRALRWDHKTVSERINTLKIREFPQKNLLPLQSAVSISNRLSFNLRSSQRIASSSSSSSSSSNRPLTLSPMSDNGQFSSSLNGSDDASTSTLRSRLRPALSVQVLHTEQLDDYTSYVLWICDVLSGVEWKVSKRFSEFYQFRQVLIEIRSTVSKFDFPSKTFGAVETATTIARRMDLFQKFMRKVIYLTCINTLHPSTIKLQLAVQGFLEVYSKFGLMEIYEGQKIAQTVTNSVQVYIHSVAHLPIMDKVFAGYVNNFYDLCSQSTASWTSAKLKTESCRHLLDGVRDFMDSLQEILCETLWEDCLQISTRILRKVRIVEPTSSITEVKSDDVFDENKLEPPQPIYTRTPAKDYEHIIHKESSVDNNVYRTLSSELNSRTKTISSIDKGEVELKSFTEDGNRPSTPPLHDVFSQNLTDDTARNLLLSNISVDRQLIADLFHNRNASEANETSPVSLSPLVSRFDLTDMDNRKVADITRSNSKSKSDFPTTPAVKASNILPITSNEISSMKPANNYAMSEDDVRLAVRTAIRKQIETEVYVPCLLALRSILKASFQDRETELQAKLQKIQHRSESYFGIPAHIASYSHWREAVVAMKAIRYRLLPIDRLEVLLQASKTISEVFYREHPGSDIAIGADDLLPVFIYVLVQAKLPHVLSIKEELKVLCDPDRRLAECGYYLATLEASVQHLSEADSSADTFFPLWKATGNSFSDSEEEDDESAESIDST